ncbi:hypothetical protein, variant 1 [Aphanomyces invadans]|uniref:Anaphase-promoting complex subunit 6 n=1 Tax=Aphanomyces invadans TaxID=157072 RepID=A0A024U8X2_9STRA|nr:hypothetical protein, variant 1 [Aphanomyces invadans]ETW02322.1 hypothetical protein, variant 1 [Aphanomyces invadans]|eukprot:XP_008868927.1 hypothetical protein, variant 1 [Aphanomyces invadans]
MFTSPVAKKQKLRMHATPETPVNRRASSSGTLFADDMQTKTVKSLRLMVQSCLVTNQQSSAVFYASKLASMTGDGLDLMLLARSYYATGDFHQAIHTLKQLTQSGPDHKGHHTPGLRQQTKISRAALPDEHALLCAYLLLGQATIAILQWEDCQEMLDAVLVGSEDHILRKAQAARRSVATNADHPQSHINVVASLCCLRGDVCEALESRERAAFWYSLALKCDVHCCDAFMHLVDDYMLSSAQERHLFESLSFLGPEDEYLKCFYASQLGRYDPSPPVPEKFHTIETVHGLQKNLDVMVAKAEAYYCQLDTEKAYEICRRIRTDAPFDYKSIPVYVSTMVQLNKRSDLFHFAHDMVAKYPTKATSWYTVGCYYLAVGNLDAAQRFFHKATNVQPQFAPAWLGFGHVFALQDESDQAMASYRTASRLYLGCHLPLLCMGMEHYRINNLPSALQLVVQARTVCPTDPLVYNELGAVYFRQRKYRAAIEMFSKALTLCGHLPQALLVAWEPTFFNMAQAYRKLREYKVAIQYYEEALALCPTSVRCRLMRSRRSCTPGVDPLWPWVHLPHAKSLGRRYRVLPHSFVV